jgi:hypothetical protein
MLTYGVVAGVSDEYCKLGNGGIEEILQSSEEFFEVKVLVVTKHGKH